MQNKNDLLVTFYNFFDFIFRPSFFGSNENIFFLYIREKLNYHLKILTLFFRQKDKNEKKKEKKVQAIVY